MVMKEDEIVRLEEANIGGERKGSSREEKGEIWREYEDC